MTCCGSPQSAPSSGKRHPTAFSYNGRNELTGASLGTVPYDYSYDNIGNRKTARELAQELTYEANELNQYTSIEENAEAPFVPTYDASGNQTLIKTSTGIWTVVYNAANRAVSFTSRDGSTVVECDYDDQGRRYMKKITQNGTDTSHERYLYRGYLQLAALDMLNSRNVIRILLWDPLEPMATRPLALVQNAALYCYGVDFNKNVTEVFDGQGAIVAAYDYSPYGAVTKAGDLIQPTQWSSEMNDEELALVYYNYRYYHTADGRWINRDPIAEQGSYNLYTFIYNYPQNIDELGLSGYFPFSPGAMNPPSTYDSPAYWPPPLKEINTAFEAVQHYRSHAGGSVPAGQKLLNQIKNSPGFQKNRKEVAKKIKEKLQKEFGNKLCSEDSGSWQNPGGEIGVYTSNNSVGNVSFHVNPYQVSWEGYFHRSENNDQVCLKTILFQGRRNLSFKDKYAFDTMQKWQQFFTDTIPGMIAGKGMPYFIFGSFTDTVSDSFTIVCDCNHEEKIY